MQRQWWPKGVDNVVALQNDDRVMAGCSGRVIKAALAAGFYPQLLRVEHPPAKFRATEGGSVQIESAAVQIKLFDRVKGRVFQHPSSVNFNCSRFESGWLIYTDMVETSKANSNAQISASDWDCVPCSKSLHASIVITFITERCCCSTEAAAHAITQYICGCQGAGQQ